MLRVPAAKAGLKILLLPPNTSSLLQMSSLAPVIVLEMDQQLVRFLIDAEVVILVERDHPFDARSIHGIQGEPVNGQALRESAFSPPGRTSRFPRLWYGSD